MNEINPKCIILAGSAGAGKTTIIKDFVETHNLKIINVDDWYKQFLIEEGISLDLKNVLKNDIEKRSLVPKIMSRATKEFNKAYKHAIENKQNIVLDRTSSSYKETLKFKQELESSGYKVLMVYVFISLKTALERNENRYEISGGTDRSILPFLILKTWQSITENFFRYKELFEDNFIAVTNETNLIHKESYDELNKKHIQPYLPENTKRKTPKQLEDVEKIKQSLRNEIGKYLSPDEINKIQENLSSLTQVKQKIHQLLEL
jgi:predicted ABC-type ATPase